MSLRLLLRDDPSRAFAIVSDTHAVTFRQSRDASTLQSESQSSGVNIKYLVEFNNLDRVDLANYRVVRNSGVHGTLGLININQDVFLCLISGAVRVATVRPNETVQRILSVNFC